MSSSGAPLEHVGVSYSEPESLVASVGPRVAEAIAEGDDVYLCVDRRTVRGFREWLGSAVERVEFPSPAEWSRDVVRDLRSIVRTDRRALVLGQYSAARILGEDQLHREAGINLVLADLPLTLLCSCDRSADPSLRASLHMAHPDLLVDGATVPNPDYRAPVPARPVTATVWGPPTLRLDFQAPVDLHCLREHVTRAAEGVGLRGETVREAVQAAHEAAMLAAGGHDPAALAHAGIDLAAAGDPERTVPCVLEVRADAGALHCEILGPRPEVVTRGDPDDDPLHIVRLFCDRALLYDEADTRSVRVLRAPDPSPIPTG